MIATIVGTLVIMGNGEDAVAPAFMAMSVLTVAATIMLRRSYSIIEPMTAVFILLLLGTPAKLFYIAVLQHLGDPRAYERILLGRDMISLTVGSALILTAMVALCIGYTLPSGRLKLRRFLLAGRVQWSWRRVSGLSAVLLALSVLGFVVFVISMQITIAGPEDLSGKRFNDLEGGTWTRLSALPYYAYRIALLARFAFYLLFVGVLLGRLRLSSINGVLLGLSAAMAAFVPFFISNRGGIALVAADAAILTLLLKRRLRVGRSVALGTAAVVLIIAIAALRQKDVQTDILWSFFGQRHFIDATKTTHIAEAVPERLPFMWGLSLVSWIVAPIPKEVWPEKPISYELGNMVSTVVFGVPTSGVPPGLVGELYMNFGWPGVAMGCLFLGIGLRLAFNTARPWLATPTSALLYTMFLTRFTVFAFNNSFGTGMMKLLTEVVQLVAILLVVTRARASPPENGAPVMGLADAVATR